METAFTPVTSFAGGLLIGLASVMLMLLHGRIAGISGILAGIVAPADRRDWGWHAAFVAGMVTAPIALVLFSGQPVAIAVPVSSPALLAGGFIVGVGVTLGSGCTSGHGVCGLARQSPRSMAATVTFMLSAMVTVYVVRHVIGA